MEPVYKETWYAPWCSAQLSRDLFVTCQPQHVVHCTDPARAAPFSPAQRYQLAEQKVGHLPARECTELFAPHMANYPCKIGNELLIPFFFSFYTGKGQEKITLFQMPVKFHFSGIMLGINLASCSQLFRPIPANSGLFPIHSKFLGCSSTFRGSLNVV